MVMIEMPPARRFRLVAFLSGLMLGGLIVLALV